MPNSAEIDLRTCTIGVIGLGQMGGGIAANLVQAGYRVLGYDLKTEAIEWLIQAGPSTGLAPSRRPPARTSGRCVGRTGGSAAQSSEDVVARADIVLTSVEGQDAIALADTVLLPNARPGQIYIDHSTVPAPQTRRIGQTFVERGTRYLDAPVSGGAQGAAAGTLRVFVGGDRATADLCWPLFEAIGNPDKIVYCGPIGMGQAAKVVQQLTVRFPDVARMEVMSFGLNAGLDLETVMRALDVAPDSQDPYARLYSAIASSKTDNLSALFSEWAYFIEEARTRGFRMPMLEAMYAFCKDGEKTGIDPLGRRQPSIWNELMRCDPASGGDPDRVIDTGGGSGA